MSPTFPCLSASLWAHYNKNGCCFFVRKEKKKSTISPFKLPDFLLPDGKGNVYFYASCDMTVIDNRLVNVISFRQNKGIKEPLYCGELYIDAENNALVQARLEINPARCV